MKTHRSLRCLATAAAFMVGWCCPSPVLATRDTEVAWQSPDAIPSEAQDVLEDLLWGDAASQREAAEEAADSLEFLDDIACQDSQFQEIFRALDKVLRTAGDDWVASQLLQSLGELSTDCLNPLYLQVLKSRSPNRRWRAIQWFADHEDPEALPFLEDAWRFEKRPWVRIDLLHAMAKNRAPGLAAELLDVAESGSPSLSSAAFRTIRSLGDPGIVTDIARLAREGKDAVRARAVTTLSSWPSSEEALTAVLDATRDGDPEVTLRAVRALGNFRNARSVERVLEIAGRGSRPAERSAALRVIDRLRPPEAVPVLTDLLHESFPEESSYLPLEAILLLERLDDAAAVPLLRDLDPGLGSEYFNVQKLIEVLSRDRTARRTRWVFLPRREDPIEEDPENPVLFLVTPQDGRLTIRCWEFPGVAGDPLHFWRIPGGSRAQAQDHFEGDDEPWLRVTSPDFGNYCWVPRRLLQPRSGEDESGEPAEAPGREEFDVQEDELLTRTAGSLMDARLLKVIEPGEAVVGVSLEVRPGDEEALALLEKNCQDGDSILDLEILALLKNLGRTCPGLCELASPYHPHCLEEEDPDAPSSDD